MTFELNGAAAPKNNAAPAGALIAESSDQNFKADVIDASVQGSCIGGFLGAMVWPVPRPDPDT
ncbi:hypothetical protein PSQ19_13700 [Devosia algicola]|uniref:Uncharacterized protein n=1 Tax=Devosia algicola TaxID=3026418 RepID=A0ABY7YT19_9HYPH|nr:hypothetical protein [Devosia algicola]WDR04396.1 hypothetical protein PSQ19_13700 [Devosia algicola]